LNQYVLIANTSKWDKDSLDNVTITGVQTITGNKTFSGTITVNTPVNTTDAVNKAYVDAVIIQVMNSFAKRMKLLHLQQPEL